jgi:lambda repressor-like predicted transcriptional regulator
MPDPTDIVYSAWLRAHQRGLSFADLSDASGLSLSRFQLSRKLRGTSPWRLDEFLAVARALGVSVVARRRAR